MATNIFSDEARRNPYPLYDQLRSTCPVLHEPQSGLWLLFDYDSVKRALADHDAFSSKLGPAEWMIFMDPPRQSKLRALVSQAFTPRSVANLEPRIRELARGLIDQVIEQGEMDLADDFSVPLPMMVIAEMLGLPAADREQFKRWNDVILNMSYTIGRRDETAAKARKDFDAITIEMNDYLYVLLAKRRVAPQDDLLMRLMAAEVEGERLTQQEILGFFQLLLLAGSETTTNLINNAMLCFMEHPDQLARLRAAPELLPSAIEEVLRYRAPFQWMIRLATREVEMRGLKIPAGNVVLAVAGSANRDPNHFPEPNRFDIARDPNPHIAFGQGIHFCLGAALESRVALSELLGRMGKFALASEQPWEPRKGLHVHGPTRLPIRFG